VSVGRSARRDRAIRAALLTLIVVVSLVVAYHAMLMVVGGVATSGEQPMATADTVPVSPTDGQWADAPTRTVSLQAQQMAVPYGGGSVDEVDVQALSNDSHVAFRLGWDDPTMDTNISEPEAYSDAAAIMLRGGEQPPITMGATGEPVNIWYWRASWQFSNKSSGGDMYAYPHPDDETQPGAAAGNPLSRNDYTQFGQNYYAEGFGSLSAAEAQPVRASAERTDDGWAVTFVRERQPEGEYGAAFEEHDQMYLAFAVWNGSRDEVNGQKSITLQYATLDTESGEFTSAGSGGSDGSDGSASGGSSGGESGGSDGGETTATASGGNATESGTSAGSGPILTDWLAILVGTTVVTYTVAYWRMRGETR